MNSLLSRVADGDTKMTERYLKAVKENKLSEFWQWHDKWFPLLDTLCQQLMTEYKGCLYESRECKKDCWVCPQEVK